MALFLIFLLGAGHGLQPDHAAAAAGLAARARIPAWSAALRVALGHCAGLIMLAALLVAFPSLKAPGFERFIDLIAASALILLGGVLLHRVWHPPTETAHHRHSLTSPTTLAVGLGWLMGLGGARSAALLMMLPERAAPQGPAAVLLAYSAGIGVGVACASGGVDLIRLLTAGRLSARWFDGAIGASTFASGCWLLFAGARV